MRKDIAVNKNLDLLNEFMKYVFDNPEILEMIPPDAELVILPIDDPELYEYNKKTADRILSMGRKVGFAKTKKPEIPVPESELMSA
jgi:hypothetical protein